MLDENRTRWCTRREMGGGWSLQSWCRLVVRYRIKTATLKQNMLSPEQFALVLALDFSEGGWVVGESSSKLSEKGVGVRVEGLRGGSGGDKPQVMKDEKEEKNDKLCRFFTLYTSDGTGCHGHQAAPRVHNDATLDLMQYSITF